MKIFNVTATRWEHGWVLNIDGVGVTQSKGVADAEMMVRDYIEVMEIATEPFAVEIEYRDEELDSEIREAREATERAAAAQDAAATKVRRVAGRLRQRNYRSSEVAKLLKVSKQRASQILKEADR